MHKVSLKNFVKHLWWDSHEDMPSVDEICATTCNYFLIWQSCYLVVNPVTNSKSISVPKFQQKNQIHQFSYQNGLKFIYIIIPIAPISNSVLKHTRPGLSFYCQTCYSNGKPCYQEIFNCTIHHSNLPWFVPYYSFFPFMNIFLCVLYDSWQENMKRPFKSLIFQVQ